MNNRILDIDKERLQIKLIVETLFYNTLSKYIADVNRRDVVNSIFEFFEKSDTVIISKQQLKVYQELEKTILDKSANFPFLKE